MRKVPDPGDKKPLKAKLLEFRKKHKKSVKEKEEEKLKSQQQQQNASFVPTSSTSNDAQNGWGKPEGNNEDQTYAEFLTRRNWQSEETKNVSSKASSSNTSTSYAAKFEQAQQNQSTTVNRTTFLALEAPPWRRILEHFGFDLLDNYPMRKWREFCAKRPIFCWLLTGCSWAIGQILAAKAEFGSVFFVCFLLLLILLNLGVREEGELSAYSVFNPNFEKLLGEMTGEDFEREVLMRRPKGPASQ